MSKKIELDVDLGHDNGGPVSPSTGPSEYFPEIHFEEDEPCDIPDSGILTCEYRLIRHSEDQKNEDRPRYGYTLEIHKLISAVSDSVDSPSKSNNDAGDALDKLAQEKADEKGY